MVHLSFSKDNFVPDTDVSDNIINIDQDAHEIQHFFYSMDMIGGGGKNNGTTRVPFFS